MQTSYIQNTEAEAARPQRSQAWLANAGWDSLWILSPAFLSAAAILIFRHQIESVQNIPLWVWVSFILLIDVAHVYASLFRTYLDPKAFQKNKSVLLAIPAIAWIGGSLLYSIDGLFFWRALAYLAVFHFIRQQFGFMILYSRKESNAVQKYRWLDCLAIYAATIYPLIFWHTHQRNFSWFVAGDFIDSMPAFLSHVGLALYVLIGTTYIMKEAALARHAPINIAKNLLLLGTALSWWVGIITVNSDMAFTITNVVSHGIPYMALVWLYHGRNQTKQTNQTNASEQKKTRSPSAFLLSNVFVFFAFLALLAYIEEGLWDGFVWREHISLFKSFWQLPQIADGAFLSLLVPFLALPQSTHYLLDGLIWRVKERNSIWSA